MLNTRLENILHSKIIGFETLTGGCVANTQKIFTDDGNTYFLKTGGTLGMFPKEANGISEIAASKTIAVPDVVAMDNDFLLLSYIKPGAKSNQFFKDFGQDLAMMHQHTASHFGFSEDNFIGSTPQVNIPDSNERSNWPLFYYNKRLKFQFLLAESKGYVNSEFRQLFSQLENKFDTIIPCTSEKPSLLHGDLWGGNFLINEEGNAVLIDPAVYYGHREADLAMTKIFGGFSPAFYSAYNECYPLADGWEYRENIYKLYHILNHLNLFGDSYYSEVISLMKFYVK